MENNKKFIITLDKDTKDALVKQGFQLISTNENVYMFINDVAKFADFDCKKLNFTFSNIMRF